MSRTRSATPTTRDVEPTQPQANQPPIRWDELQPRSDALLEDRWIRMHNARCRVAWRITRAIARFPQGTRLTRLATERASPNHLGIDKWARRIAAVIEDLNPGILLPGDPHHASEYLWSLLHPDPEQRAPWPSPAEILNHETKAIRQTAALLAKSSQNAIDTFDRIQIELGYLTEDETHDLIKLARKEAKKFTHFDSTEDERAMMILRTQHVAAEADKAFNLREVTNALKLESALRGLTRNSDQDGGDMLAVFARVVNRPQPAEPDAHVIEALGTTGTPALALGGPDYDDDPADDPRPARPRLTRPSTTPHGRDRNPSPDSSSNQHLPRTRQHVRPHGNRPSNGTAQGHEWLCSTRSDGAIQ